MSMSSIASWSHRLFIARIDLDRVKPVSNSNMDIYSTMLIVTSQHDLSYISHSLIISIYCPHFCY